jgi:hypothetical protein
MHTGNWNGKWEGKGNHAGWRESKDLRKWKKKTSERYKRMDSENSMEV